MSIRPNQLFHRIVFEFEHSNDVEHFLTFIGDAIENGELDAPFEWFVEGIQTYEMEDDDE